MTFVSQTQYGKNEDFALQVSRGQIPGHQNVIVFGYNPDVDTTEESVWPDGGTVPHPTSASVLKVSSSNASDTSAGTGARTVYIEGVDANYDVMSEIVVLNGQTSVNTQYEYRFINNMYVVTVGSSGHNVGDINIGTGTVTSGVPTVLYDIIGATFNNRTTAHFMVPAGYTGYMAQGLFTAGQSSGTTGITGKLIVTGPDNISRVGAIVAINNGAVDYAFNYPYKIPEKTCVGATAIGSASNNIVSTMFNIVLVRN